MDVTARINRQRKTLLIEIPYQRAVPSGSGKTIVVATTHGCKTTTLQDSHGRPVVVNATAFVYPEKDTRKKNVKRFIASEEDSGRFLPSPRLVLQKNPEIGDKVHYVNPFTGIRKTLERPHSEE